MENKILSSNITVQKLFINISVKTIDYNVDAISPTTEVNNLSVGHTSHQELLVSNTSVYNSMNVLLEIISEGHASRHESDDLSVRYASRQEPLQMYPFPM